MIHILLNNAAHDSVGGQPTCASKVNIPKIAKSCGYASVKSIANLYEISSHIERCRKEVGPHLLEIKVKKGSRENLGRPTTSPKQNKKALMSIFEGENAIS